MGSYQIWCQTIAVSTTLHVATVCAVPARTLRGSSGLESDTRIFGTDGEARAESARMVGVMKDRLEAGGHDVSGISFLLRPAPPLA
jgi:hypothetical protein